MSAALQEYEDDREPSAPVTPWSRCFFVAVYLEDRAYGGPEEGGWWFDCGQLVRPVRMFRNEEKAYAFCRRMNALLRATLNKGRREISSVLSEGCYAASVHQGVPPAHFPETIPHYE